ncbi:MAG: aminotransferase class IV [Dehalococcoidia bacterium]
MPLVWLDGVLVSREDARVSVDDLGFLYGAACFETMRSFDAVVFRLDRHFDRLEAGLAALGVPAPPRDELRAALEATLGANGLRDARLRLTVSAGRGAGRPDLRTAQGPTVLVVAEPAPDPAAPARLAVASTRVDERRPLAFAKTANYLLSLLALDEARRAGCDEALLLNRRDHVAEGATSNLFAVLDSRLVTPPLSDGPLPGVAREVVLECAARLGIATEERSLGLEDLSAADELFLTNSVIGLRAVSDVAGHWRPATVPGPLTIVLQDEYGRVVRRECAAEE